MTDEVWQIGDRVEHRIKPFGRGTVVKVEWRTDVGERRQITTVKWDRPIESDQRRYHQRRLKRVDVITRIGELDA